jgi:hypothetical protein
VIPNRLGLFFAAACALAASSGCAQLLGIDVPSADVPDGGDIDAGDDPDADPDDPDARPDADPDDPDAAPADAAVDGGFVVGFRDAVKFDVGVEPSGILMVDLNSDGKRDLVIADTGIDKVSVLLNTTANGATEPTFAAQNLFAVASKPEVVAVGDIDGDGKLDLAVGSSSVTNQNVAILFGTTAPNATTATFKPVALVAAKEFPAALALVDLNGDGKVDLVVGNRTSDEVSVFLNKTAPGSSAPSFHPRVDFFTGDAPGALAVGDVTGDGKPDIALGCFGDNAIAVHRNVMATGATVPAFANPVESPVAAGVHMLVIADMNGDDKADLVAVDTVDDNLSVLLNKSTSPTEPSFASPVAFAAGEGVFTIAADDINGDGKVDLAAANNVASPPSVSVLLNKTANGASTPSFDGKVDFGTGALEPFGVAIGDLNGDGRRDLAVTGHLDDKVSVLLAE